MECKITALTAMSKEQKNALANIWRLYELIQRWGKSKPTVTIEDVKRLIEENNIKLQGNHQV